MDLDLQGKIERFTLPEIFQLVSVGQKTGTLGIQRDDDIVMVYFKNGSVIYGYGPRKTYHLGRMLVDKGRLTTEQLDEAITEQAGQRSSGRRIGQILMERRYIDRTDLEDVVRRQVEELIYSLMSWDRGSFKFYENQFPTEEEITVNLSIENVVLEGIRRLDELNRIKEYIPDFGVIYALAAAEGGQRRDITLEPDEWNILALVDGRRSIHDIIEVTGMDSLAVLKRIASLQLAGLIRPVSGMDMPGTRLEGMVERLSQLIEDYLTDRAGSTLSGGTGEEKR